MNKPEESCASPTTTSPARPSHPVYLDHCFLPRSDAIRSLAEEILLDPACLRDLPRRIWADLQALPAGCVDKSESDSVRLHRCEVLALRDLGVLLASELKDLRARLATKAAHAAPETSVPTGDLS